MDFGVLEYVLIYVVVITAVAGTLYVVDWVMKKVN